MDSIPPDEASSAVVLFSGMSDPPIHPGLWGGDIYK